VTFNESNKLLGFFLVPHKTFDQWDEKTVLKIKSDDIELNGTLLMPSSNNKKKLVIFVHGSGPATEMKRLEKTNLQGYCRISFQ
jgi:hypothetical protein